MNTRTFSLFTSALIFSVLLTACSDSKSVVENRDSTEQAPIEGTSQTPTTPGEQDADLGFHLVENLYGSIELIREGRKHGRSQEVKVLAEELETAHVILKKDFLSLGEEKGWAVPMGPTKKYMEEMRTTTIRERKNYDTKWLEEIKVEHSQHLQTLSKTNSADPEVQAALKKRLSEWKQLAARIDTLQQTIGYAEDSI